jgi:hypothetical protein
VLVSLDHHLWRLAVLARVDFCTRVYVWCQLKKMTFTTQLSPFYNLAAAHCKRERSEISTGVPVQSFFNAPYDASIKAS